MRNLCDKPCNTFATELSHGPCVSRRRSATETAVFTSFSSICRTVAFPMGAAVRLRRASCEERCDSYATT